MIIRKVELLSLGSGQERSCKENTGRQVGAGEGEAAKGREYSTVLLPGRKKSRAQWGLHCSMLFREKAKCRGKRTAGETIDGRLQSSHKNVCTHRERAKFASSFGTQGWAQVEGSRGINCRRRRPQWLWVKTQNPF